MGLSHCRLVRSITFYKVFGGEEDGWGGGGFTRIENGRLRYIFSGVARSIVDSFRYH